MRVAVIGDVHGRKTELVRLLRRIESRQPDRIVLLGDLVDRGPSSHGCLSVARRYQFRARSGQKKHLEIVQGNHEDAYWRWAFGVPKPGRATPARAEYPAFAASLSPRDIAWFRRLPISIRVPMKGLDLLLLHGGVLPGMQTLEAVDERALRVRYLDQHDDALAWPQKSERFWADDYDGRFGFVVFGHESWSRPTYFPWALGLDGHSFGKIHAAILTDERSGLRVSCTLSQSYEWEAWELSARKRIWGW